MTSIRPWNEVMRDKINKTKCIRFIGNENVSFITIDDLRDLWKTSFASFRDMQTAIHLNFDESGIPFDDYTRVISILTVVDFKPFEAIGSIITQGFKDADLPFRYEDLVTRWFKSISDNVAFAEDFVSKQYAFCPVVINEGHDLEHDDRHLLLPILKEEHVGKGSFADVFKVKIARGYFRSTGSPPIYNTKEIVLARKRFRVALEGQIEQESLDRLRRAGWGNECIISSLASVRLGGSTPSNPVCEYNLFFDYAPSDLFKFLCGDTAAYEQLEITPARVTPKALFRELFNLVDALQYLHREELRMCHSDLKPDNILIFVPEVRKDHPIGHWKLTDFGVASIEPRPQQEAQSVRDVIRSTARRSVLPSLNASSEDQRQPGQFHPPEVEFPELVAPGQRYRAKGDIWSLGCIGIYVLAFALGGGPCVRGLQDCLHTVARPSHRHGFFYEENSDGSLALYEGVAGFVNNLTTQWDAWAKRHFVGNTWVSDVWSMLLNPMLRASVNARTHAKPLWDGKDRIQRQIPSVNVWEGRVMPVEASSTLSIPERPALASTLLGPPLGRPTSAIQEELDGNSNLVSSKSTTSTSPLPIDIIASTVPQYLTTRVPYFDVRALLKFKCNTVQISGDGLMVIVKTKGGIRCLVKDDQSPTGWSLKEGLEDKFYQEWTWLAVSGSYLLLRNKALSRSGSIQMYLRHLTSATQDHLQEWNHSNLPFLSGVSHVALSCRGYVALRFASSKTLAVYDQRARSILEWDLATFNPIPATSKRRSSSGWDHANFEAVAFDPDGRYLVATAWNSWFLWDIESLLPSRSPSRHGRHSYTPTETSHSKCTLHVLSGARFFLLHDQYHEKQCILVDTSQSNKIYNFNLAGRPKPETIAVSPSCDWIAYLVESSFAWNTDSLHIGQLQNCAFNSTALPGVGDIRKLPLHKIKTEKRNHASVVDTAIKIVSLRGNYFAVLASITGYIETFQLQS